jgi:hypothetical protein
MRRIFNVDPQWAPASPTGWELVRTYCYQYSYIRVVLNVWRLLLRVALLAGACFGYIQVSFSRSICSTLVN